MWDLFVSAVLKQIHYSFLFCFVLNFYSLTCYLKGGEWNKTVILVPICHAYCIEQCYFPMVLKAPCPT